ncbi:MAG TPA: double zinc ribbon domain-containing protein [Gaiellaceae bacterium]|nr:double zinc ribbon domain-containing protein [Gaiellaceae bacterium]
MLDLLLPQRCVLCGAGGAQLCPGCAAALPPLDPPLCERCGAPAAWPVRRCRECSGQRLAFAVARAAVAYDDAVRTIVAGWKEHGLRRFAGIAADVVAARVPAPSAELVTFVPADDDRRRRRGHHPAAELAIGLAARWSLPCEPLLLRTGELPRQRGLTLAERRRNVAHAFGSVETTARTVVLVDDVYTSGATVNAAASALRAAGARRVEVVTFARAIRTLGVGLQGRRTVPI